jgi:hypothetical protein
VNSGLMPYAVLWGVMALVIRVPGLLPQVGGETGGQLSSPGQRRVGATDLARPQAGSGRSPGQDTDRCYSALRLAACGIRIHQVWNPSGLVTSDGSVHLSKEEGTRSDPNYDI